MGYRYAALGGVLGAWARWAVGEVLPISPGAWPWATFLVNITGCLFIGVLLAVLLARFPRSVRLRPFLAVGVLGGFTTYSTFAVEAVRLTEGGHPALAAGYVLASVTGGVAAVVIGLLGGRAVVGRVDTVDAELRAGEGET